MSRDDRQTDLFDEPPAPSAPERALLPPYTLAEMEDLDRQLRSFERLPDSWCAGWAEMYQRADDTLRQTPRDQREPFRALFFEQATRLLVVERIECEAAEAAEAARARSAKANAKRKAGKVTQG